MNRFTDHRGISSTILIRFYSQTQLILISHVIDGIHKEILGEPEVTLYFFPLPDINFSTNIIVNQFVSPPDGGEIVNLCIMSPFGYRKNRQIASSSSQTHHVPLWVLRVIYSSIMAKVYAKSNRHKKIATCTSSLGDTFL